MRIELQKTFKMGGCGAMLLWKSKDIEQAASLPGLRVLARKINQGAFLSDIESNRHWPPAFPATAKVGLGKSINVTGFVNFTGFALDPKDHSVALPHIALRDAAACLGRGGPVKALPPCRPVDTSASHVGFRCVIRS